MVGRLSGGGLTEAADLAASCDQEAEGKCSCSVHFPCCSLSPQSMRFLRPTFRAGFPKVKTLLKLPHRHTQNLPGDSKSRQVRNKDTDTGRSRSPSFQLPVLSLGPSSTLGRGQAEELFGSFHR